MKWLNGNCRVLLLAVLLQLPAPLIAQDGGAANIEMHGFLLGNFSGRTTGQRPPGKEGEDFLLAEERLRLDIFGWAEAVEASARVKGDVFHDAVADEFEADLREAYLDYSTAAFDFRLGRQTVTWGVGDLLFINDVFPKDWVSFFSGRPLEYLKVGVDGCRSRYSAASINAEFLVLPFFEPDNLPTASRFFFFDPFAAVAFRPEDKPDTSFSNTELALRLYRRLGDFDVSAYAYKGFWRTPSLRPDNPVAPSRLTIFYPELAVYGLSAQGSGFKGVLSFEAGYYHSRQDEDGDDPVIPNSQFKFLTGYQRQIGEDFTVGLQYLGEIIADHAALRDALPAGFPAPRQYRDVLTLRLEQFFMHQSLNLGLFSFYSPADNDYLIQPKAAYKFSDKFSATLGANIFGGQESTTFLGQFDKNDNIYLSGRFDF